MEHINDCFRLAYATGRVFIYSPRTLTYIKNYTEVFHNISETCTEIQKDEEKFNWPGIIFQNKI
jgi:hypothetical protein